MIVSYENNQFLKYWLNSNNSLKAYVHTLNLLCPEKSDESEPREPQRNVYGV